jgi:hypothetical protein
VPATRLALALALALVTTACGGSNEKAAEKPDTTAADRAACDGGQADPQACSRLCAGGDEGYCQKLVNLCLGGDAQGCMVLGDTYAREGDNGHAAGAYKLACQLGQAAGCGKTAEDGSTTEPAPAP